MDDLPLSTHSAVPHVDELVAALVDLGGLVAGHLTHMHRSRQASGGVSEPIETTRRNFTATFAPAVRETPAAGRWATTLSPLEVRGGRSTAPRAQPARRRASRAAESERPRSRGTTQRAGELLAAEPPAVVGGDAGAAAGGVPTVTVWVCVCVCVTVRSTVTASGGAAASPTPATCISTVRSLPENESVRSARAAPARVGRSTMRTVHEPPGAVDSLQPLSTANSSGSSPSLRTLAVVAPSASASFSMRSANAADRAPTGADPRSTSSHGSSGAIGREPGTTLTMPVAGTSVVPVPTVMTLETTVIVRGPGVG